MLRNWNSYVLLGEKWICTATLKYTLAVFFLIKLYLSLDLVILPLGIYSSEFKTYIHPKVCMQVFIAVLFITEEIWKPPKCPSTDEWLKTLRCIQKMNYCLVKKNKLTVTYKQMENFQSTLLNVRNKTQYQFIIWFQLYDILEEANYRDRKHINNFKEWVWRGELTTK